jgi:phosphotransferase system enzyme I (PtsP)
MPGALGGPRVLLRRLREVMAEPVSAQERLDKIVVLIAANMVAEVCSVYVLRVDGTLELYATEGLKREAVHQTVLRQDEGLVGLVASEANPINLSEAQTHPAFSFRPETGEEIYHSFLGVPVLRAGNTLGVLVVQNRASRAYSEEEEEALQTTAMVLAEMIASGELLSLASPAPSPRSSRGCISPGGARRRHRARPCGAARAARHGEERHRRRRAEGIEAARRLDRRVARRPRPHAGAPRRRRQRRAPRGARRLPQLCPRPGLAASACREAVGTGLTAEAGVERVQSDNRARMLRVTDPYIRERLHDLDDLGNRLMRQLMGQDQAPPREQLPTMPFWSPARWGPRRCSTTTAESSAA